MARPNKIIIILVKALVSSGLLYIVISKTGTDKVFSILRDINIFFFLFAVLMYLSSVYISSIRWKLLLPDGFALRKLFSLYIIGAFFNNLLPGIVGGDAIKAYYLYKDTGKGGAAIASVFMDRYIGFSALMFIGLMAFPFGLSYFHGSLLVWVLPVTVFLFIIGSFFVFTLKLGKGIKMLSEFYNYFGIYRGRKPVIIKTFLISIIIQITAILSVHAISMGLGIKVPLPSLFIFIPIISTVTSIPISISGMGIREASFVLLLGSIGISPVQATAISFAWFLSVVSGSLPGLAEYLAHKKVDRNVAA